jgi:hypothetical protein
VPDAADDHHVRVIQNALGVEDPGVVDERPAVHVAADVHAARAEAGLGDGGVGGLEVRGRDLMRLALGGAVHAGKARGGCLRALAAGERAAAGALLGVERPPVAAAVVGEGHRRPRPKGSP